MKGSCLCGEIEFEVNLNRLKIYQCHCEQCRKQSGTASSCGSVVESNKFSWVSGQSNISKWIKDSGFTSHFCSSCGSPVPNEFRGMPYCWIPVGLMETDEIEIVANLYVCEAAKWGSVSKDVNPFETKPELESLIKYLNE
jgi:hypothetical protein